MDLPSSVDLQKLREAVSSGRFEWRKHVLQRLASRGIPQSHVVDVLMKGEKIRDYSDDKPFPSAVFLGWIDTRPIHVVVAFDPKSNWGYIISAYEPDLEHFKPDFKTRRPS